MIQTNHKTKILVAIQPIDFRKRLDGTAAICRGHYHVDPLNGTIYAFRNRASTYIRLYFFDGLVEWGCDLRIAKGRFPHWPQSQDDLTEIQTHQLMLLIKGADPMRAKTLPNWKKLA